MQAGGLLAPGGQEGAGGSRVSRGTHTGRTGGGGGEGDPGETHPAIFLTLGLAACRGGAGRGSGHPVVTCNGGLVRQAAKTH